MDKFIKQISNGMANPATLSGEPAMAAVFVWSGTIAFKVTELDDITPAVTDAVTAAGTVSRHFFTASRPFAAKTTECPIFSSITARYF